MCTSPFSPAYMPHPQRWYIDGGFGLIPIQSNNTDAGSEESWLEIPHERAPGVSAGEPSRKQNRLGDLQPFAKQIVPDPPDTRVTSGHLTYKSNRKRDVAFPRSGSVTWLPPDDLFLCSSIQISKQWTTKGSKGVEKGKSTFSEHFGKPGRVQCLVVSSGGDTQQSQ